MCRRLGRSKTLLVILCGFVVRGHRHAPCGALQHDAEQQIGASVRRGIPRPPQPAASPASGVALTAEVSYRGYKHDNCAEMALGLCMASVPQNRRPSAAASALARAWGCAFPAVWHLAGLPATFAASIPSLRRVLHRPLFFDHQDVFGSVS